jgi:dephospho-CoA kinase
VLKKQKGFAVGDVDAAYRNVVKKQKELAHSVEALFGFPWDAIAYSSQYRWDGWQ